MAKRFDKCLIVSIYTVHDLFKEYFPDGESVRDSIGWMKDTYCISDESITSIEITYRTIYKRSNSD